MYCWIIRYKKRKRWLPFLHFKWERIIKTIHEIDNILKECPLGEIILHSMNRDGTGQGYDLNSLSLINKDINIPIIISGGWE